jgi:hypothetical protein
MAPRARRSPTMSAAGGRCGRCCTRPVSRTAPPSPEAAAVAAAAEWGRRTATTNASAACAAAGSGCLSPCARCIRSVWCSSAAVGRRRDTVAEPCTAARPAAALLGCTGSTPATWTPSCAAEVLAGADSGDRRIHASGAGSSEKLPATTRSGKPPDARPSSSADRSDCALLGGHTWVSAGGVAGGRPEALRACGAAGRLTGCVSGASASGVPHCSGSGVRTSVGALTSGHWLAVPAAAAPSRGGVVGRSGVLLLMRAPAPPRCLRGGDACPAIVSVARAAVAVAGGPCGSAPVSESMPAPTPQSRPSKVPLNECAGAPSSTSSNRSPRGGRHRVGGAPACECATLTAVAPDSWRRSPSVRVPDSWRR